MLKLTIVNRECPDDARLHRDMWVNVTHVMAVMALDMPHGSGVWRDYSLVHFDRNEPLAVAGSQDDVARQIADAIVR